MSSSTSNFKQEFKVLAIVAAVLLTNELAVRGLETRLSVDMVHIRSLPQVAARLKYCRDLRVLFVGNSKARSDINPSVMKDTLARLGAPPITIERLHPEATTVMEWYYYFKHYFVDSGCKPDVLVVCFTSFALRDDRLVFPERLGGYSTGAEDTMEVFRDDLHDFGRRTEFLLSKASCAFANRRRIRIRALDTLIPGYRTAAVQLNAMLRFKDVAATAHEYRIMIRFINLASGEGITVLFVAMPMRDDYPVDSGVLSTIQNHGLPYLDLRHVEGIGAEQFEDSLHLNAEGAVVFSRQLATDLMKTYPAIFTRPIDTLAGNSQKP
jgi:hypothetical protein